MNSEQQSQPQFALVTERELRLLSFCRIVMLAIATGLAVGIDQPLDRQAAGGSEPRRADGRVHGADPGVAAQWQPRRQLMAACYAALLVLMAALVLRIRSFGFYTWTGYIWGSVVFASGWWRLLVYAPVAVITATRSTAACPPARRRAGSGGSRSSRST